MHIYIYVYIIKLEGHGIQKDLKASIEGKIMGHIQYKSGRQSYFREGKNTQGGYKGHRRGQ